MDPELDSLIATIRREVARRQRQLRVPNLQGSPESSAGPAYEWGERLTFGTGGNARPFLGPGWSIDEPGFVWTDGPSAHLLFPAPPPGRDLRLRLWAFPALGGAQGLRLRVGGQVALRWRLDAEKCCEGRVFFHRLSSGSRVDWRLEPETPRAPASLGISEDVRMLGIGVRALETQIL
jgi:hypothetical protein